MLRGFFRTASSIGRRRTALRLAALLLAACCGGALAQTSEPVRPISDAQLATALRAGGLVVYYRHTSTDFSRNDEKMANFDDCDNQRPLSDKGRAEARSIGNEWQRLKFPVGRVLASPYCRTREVAQLIYGAHGHAVERSFAVRGGPQQEGGDRYTELKQIFSTAPSSGKNLIISSHGNPFQAVAGSPYLREGEAAVVRPLGAGRWEVIARLGWEDWARLR
jgi:phosphohistidine phosphatase SixA